MKCVTVSNYFPDHHGGLEIVVGELTTRIANDRMTVDWFACAPAPFQASSPTPLRYHGVKAWNGIEAKTGLPMPIWDPGGVLRLARTIRKADVIFINDCLYISSWVAWIIARIYRKKIVLLQHIDEIPYSSRALTILMRRSYSLAAHVILRGSDRVVFCSRKVERYFLTRFSFLRNTLHISNGVDAKLFCPDERTAVAPRPRILFAGRFVERKGLEIVRQLATNLPGCDWIMAGWGVIDPKNWGLKNVHVVGRRDRQSMAELYRDCDLLVLPSVGEGFPLVVQEAISCGLPVLVSRETAGGDPAAANFIMVADLSVSAFEKSVRAFVQRRHQELDPLLRRRRHEFAVAHWNWERAAQQYQDIFAEITSPGAQR